MPATELKVLASGFSAAAKAGVALVEKIKQAGDLPKEAVMLSAVVRQACRELEDCAARGMEGDRLEPLHLQLQSSSELLLQIEERSQHFSIPFVTDASFTEKCKDEVSRLQSHLLPMLVSRGTNQGQYVTTLQAATEALLSTLSDKKKAAVS